MKKTLLTGLSAAIMFFPHISYADFNFHSGRSDACEYAPGQWAGSGKATNWFIGECDYHGSGSSSSLDAEGNFSIHVIADKDSGSFLCPSHEEKLLTGNCKDGNVTIATEYGNLTGSFTPNTGEANGTLYVAGVGADVSLQFQRAG